MIWFWTAVGVMTGWLSSHRDSWGVVLLAVSGFGLAVLAAAHRFETEALLSVAVFWIAAQGAWFLTHLAEERRTAARSESSRRAVR